MGIGYTEDKDFINSAKKAAALTEAEKEAIRRLELAAAHSAVALKQKAQKDASQRLYNQTYGTQATALDTIRKANAGAIATGASKGIQAANELSAILGMQKTAAEEATLLADQDYALADEYESALLEASRSAEANIADKEKSRLTDIMAGLATKYQADTEFALTPTPAMLNKYLSMGDIASAKSVYYQLHPDATDEDWQLYQLQQTAFRAENDPNMSTKQKAQARAEAAAAEEEAANADYTFARLKRDSGLNRAGDIFTMVSKSGKEYKLTTELDRMVLTDPFKQAIVNSAPKGQLFVVSNVLVVKDSKGNLRTVTGPGYDNAYNSIRKSTKYNLGNIGYRTNYKGKAKVNG